MFFGTASFDKLRTGSDRPLRVQILSPAAATRIPCRLRSLMKERLPGHLLSLFQRVGEIADLQGVSVYAVGGIVRDLLLAAPTPGAKPETRFDVDLVVEGNGIRFANAIAQRYQARVTIHERFGTAIVTFADGHRFDVATARTESYDSPAALPTVQRSSITQDVYRRDFTINTLAIRLNASRFGELVDIHDGLRDLQNKTIRVLHGLSFIDDPTRVFRAIRFEQRLGFELDPNTAVLVKEAVNVKIFHRLSPSRLSTELLHVLSEREPVKTLARLADFNLLQFIHPRLKWSPTLARLLNAAEQAVAWHAGLSPGRLTSPWVVYGMALMDSLPQPAVQETLARLTFPRRQTQSMLWVSQEGARLLRSLERIVNPSDTFRALRNLPDETLVFLMAKIRSERGKQNIYDQFATYRRVRPILRGNDLKAIGLEPGPLYNRILERLLDARLNGEVKTEADERRLVSRLVKRA